MDTGVIYEYINIPKALILTINTFLQLKKLSKKLMTIFLITWRSVWNKFNKICDLLHIILSITIQVMVDLCWLYHLSPSPVWRNSILQFFLLLGNTTPIMNIKFYRYRPQEESHPSISANWACADCEILLTSTLASPLLWLWLKSLKMSASITQDNSVSDNMSMNMSFYLYITVILSNWLPVLL